MSANSKLTALRVTWADILNWFGQESFSEEVTIRKSVHEVRQSQKKYLGD